MKKICAVLLVLMISGCRTETPKQADLAANESASITAEVEGLLTKDDILGLLSQQGLNPQTRTPPDVSKKMAEALSTLSEAPTDRFLLGIDNEGLMAFQFSSVEIAKLMESRHEGEGFRHHNWYLGGKVSAEVYNKTKNALKK